jgi:DNA-binding MarR family transcriptional regulator
MAADRRHKSAEISVIEKRVLQTICASSSPLGAAAAVVTRLLALRRDIVSSALKHLEARGFCTRERVGVQVYLRPTREGIAYCSAHDDTAPKQEEAAPFLVPAAPGKGHEPTESINAPNASVLLTNTQVAILAAAARTPGAIATSRLVELTQLSNREVHRQASRLYARGFLSRQRDGRRWYWGLTRKAHAHVKV